METKHGNSVLDPPTLNRDQLRDIPFQFPDGIDQVVTVPVDGDTAWFEVGDGVPREYRIFRSGQWVPDPDKCDQGL
jgi:hypothetical protein